VPNRPLSSNAPGTSTRLGRPAGWLAGWLAVAVIGLVHTAADQVAAGHLTVDEAYVVFSDTALRLCGVAGTGGK
jgi:hypothetical protein